MYNNLAILTAVLSVLTVTPADACSLNPPPVDETIAKVASGGMLVSGRVIRALDLDKNQSEIIRVDKIFIGEGSPRDLEIYRSPLFFEQARKRREEQRRRNRQLVLCPGQQTYRLGQSFERLILVPAVAENGAKVANKWSVEFWGDYLTMAKGLNLLIDEAELKGRFQSRPPKSRRWGDCMECNVP